MTPTAKFENREILYWITPTGATMSNNDYSYCSTAQQEQCIPVYNEPINPPQMKTSDSNTAMSDEQLIEKCKKIIVGRAMFGGHLDGDDVKTFTELLSRFQKAQKLMDYVQHKDSCDTQFLLTGLCTCGLTELESEHTATRPAPSDIVEKCVEAVVKEAYISHSKGAIMISEDKIRTALKTVLEQKK